MGIIFDGQKLAEEKEKFLRQEVEVWREKTGITPKLIAIMVGDNPASRLYLNIKKKVAERVGVVLIIEKFPCNIDLTLLLRRIRENNEDSSVNGIMIQLPLPKQLTINNQQLIILNSIDPKKDVDCLTPESLGLLAMGKPRFLPATVKAVIVVLEEAARVSVENFDSTSDSARKNSFGINGPSSREAPCPVERSSLRGRKMKPHKICQTSNALCCSKQFLTDLSRYLKEKNIVLVGAGELVGKPLIAYLKSLGAKATVCDEFTKNIPEKTLRAEILISATGVPNLIKKEMVKEGAVVIDVGSPKGDVDFEGVKEIASFITPVPGGVGPLTVVSLMENVLLAAK